MESSLSEGNHASRKADANLWTLKIMDLILILSGEKVLFAGQPRKEAPVKVGCVRFLSSKNNTRKALKLPSGY